MINLISMIPMPIINNLIYREWYVLLISAILLIIILCYLPLSFCKSIKNRDANEEVYKLRLAMYVFNCRFYYMYPNYKYGE